MNQINRIDQIDTRDLYLANSDHYYNQSHSIKTRQMSENIFLYKNPILWKMAINSKNINVDMDLMNPFCINTSIENYSITTNTNTCIFIIFKILLDKSSFNNDDEAKDAERWLSIYDFQKLTNYKFKHGTYEASLRELRKQPAGAFSIIRRFMSVEPFDSEYCLIVDTLGRKELDIDPDEAELLENYDL